MKNRTVLLRIERASATYVAHCSVGIETYYHSGDLLRMGECVEIVEVESVLAVRSYHTFTLDGEQQTEVKIGYSQQELDVVLRFLKHSHDLASLLY